jgi:hypothetical protein
MNNKKLPLPMNNKKLPLRMNNKKLPLPMNNKKLPLPMNNKKLPNTTLFPYLVFALTPCKKNYHFIPFLCQLNNTLYHVRRIYFIPFYPLFFLLVPPKGDLFHTPHCLTPCKNFFYSRIYFIPIFPYPFYPLGANWKTSYHLFIFQLPPEGDLFHTLHCLTPCKNFFLDFISYPFF